MTPHQISFPATTFMIICICYFLWDDWIAILHEMQYTPSLTYLVPSSYPIVAEKWKQFLPIPSFPPRVRVFLVPESVWGPGRLPVLWLWLLLFAPPLYILGQVLPNFPPKCIPDPGLLPPPFPPPLWPTLCSYETT